MNKYFKWGIIGFEVMLIVSLMQGMGKSRKARERVDNLEIVKIKLIQERAELLGRLEYVQGSDYLEKIAREELDLAKEGEVVVIVPDTSSQFLVLSSQEEEGDKSEKSNWEKWLAVFGVE